MREKHVLSFHKAEDVLFIIALKSKQLDMRNPVFLSYLATICLSLWVVYGCVDKALHPVYDTIVRYKR